MTQAHIHPTAANPASVSLAIRRFIGQEGGEATDQVAVEEPLEIRIAFGPKASGAVAGEAGERTIKPIAITMRTPTVGHDFELAVGFLFSEGIIHAPADVERVIYCGPET